MIILKQDMTVSQTATPSGVSDRRCRMVSKRCPFWSNLCHKNGTRIATPKSTQLLKKPLESMHRQGRVTEGCQNVHISGPIRARKWNQNGPGQSLHWNNESIGNRKHRFRRQRSRPLFQTGDRANNYHETIIIWKQESVVSQQPCFNLIMGGWRYRN